MHLIRSTLRHENNITACVPFCSFHSVICLFPSLLLPPSQMSLLPKEQHKMKLHFKRMYFQSCTIRLLTRNGCNKLGNCYCFTLIIFISLSIFQKTFQLCFVKLMAQFMMPSEYCKKNNYFQTITVVNW